MDLPAQSPPPSPQPVPPPLPAVKRWTVPTHWQAIDLVSDLHLCAATPRTFSAFDAYLRRTTADAVVRVGDVFEFWVGDDQRDQPFERQCIRLLAETAARRHLAFMVGNRDFLAGPSLQAACGWAVLDDPTLVCAFGQRWLLSHGDALCLADTDYQRFRMQSRRTLWQSEFLSRPLSERLAQAKAARAASEARRQGSGLDPELWADVDPEAAIAWLRAAGATTLLHGHTHRPGSHPLAPGMERVVLSDWDLDHGVRAEVLRWSAGGLERLPLEFF